MTTQTKITNKREVPTAQSIQYICERAEAAMAWLEELEKEFQHRKNSRKDCYEIQRRKRIIADIISVYVTTLVDPSKNTNSLVASYPKNDFVTEFANLPIVKKCKMNRYNRSAHESKSYGHFVSPGELLNSDLKRRFSDITCFVCLIRP